MSNEKLPIRYRVALITSIVLIVLNLAFWFIILMEGGLDRGRGGSRDARRQSDIRQISLAQEIFYDDGNGYATTTIDSDGRITITSIGSYLDPLPIDLGGGKGSCNNKKNGHYCGLDNTKDNSKYCIFAQLEGTNEYFVASWRGTYATDTMPSSLDECNRRM